MQKNINSIILVIVASLLSGKIKSQDISPNKEDCAQMACSYLNKTINVEGGHFYSLRNFETRRIIIIYLEPVDNSINFLRYIYSIPIDSLTSIVYKKDANSNISVNINSTGSNIFHKTYITSNNNVFSDPADDTDFDKELKIDGTYESHISFDVNSSTSITESIIENVNIVFAKLIDCIK